MRKRKFCLSIVSCFIFSLSIACAGSLSIDKEELQKLPAVHQIKGVKPIKQGPRECGPTCMAMVLNFWGVNITKDELWKKVKSPFGSFTKCTDMRSYFSRHNFNTMVLRTTNYTKLKYFLYKGYPLIAYVESRKHPGSAHYIVLTGYQVEGFNIIDPEFGYAESLTYETFKKLHTKSIDVCGPYWTLVVCPEVQNGD